MVLGKHEVPPGRLANGGVILQAHHQPRVARLGAALTEELSRVGVAWRRRRSRRTPPRASATTLRLRSLACRLRLMDSGCDARRYQLRGDDECGELVQAASLVARRVA